MFTTKRWILAPALILGSVFASGSQEAKADVRVVPSWGGISISFGNHARACNTGGSSFFGSVGIQRPSGFYFRPSIRSGSLHHHHYRSHRPSNYLRSRSRTQCSPRYRR